MIYIHLFLVNIIWGMNVIVTKLNYSYFHPIFLSLLKILFSTLALLGYIYLKKIPFEKVLVKKLCIEANLINVINFLLTYMALVYVEGNTVATINCLAPLIMFLIVTPISKFNNKTILFLFVSVFGFLVTIHFRLFDIGMGSLFLLIALVVYNIGNYKLKDIHHNSYIYNLYMFIISFFEFLIILFFVREPLFYHVNIFYLWLFVLTSGVGYAYIQCVYFVSIRKIGPLKTSFFMAFNPLFTYVFSLIFFKEKFDFVVTIGFLIIFCSSLYFILKKEN